eukprot:TRINITY_DN17390_c0_g1_i1.p1 TRINITY_DN17390_c0_g1~~TRINITY_DN17390_c0_g1_i1.p1  ORF type:complete len:286 (-),score=54.85 TRINITY_DN17390_c0_g1_i1:5-862(-)
MDCWFNIMLLGHEAKFQLRFDKQSQQVAALYGLRELLQICKVGLACDICGDDFAAKLQECDSNLEHLQSMCTAGAASPRMPRIESEGKLQSLDLEAHHEARASDLLARSSMTPLVTTRQHGVTSAGIGTAYALQKVAAEARSCAEGNGPSVSDSENSAACGPAPIEAHYEPQLLLVGQRSTCHMQCSADAARGAGVESEPISWACRQRQRECSADAAERRNTDMPSGSPSRQPSSPKSIFRRLLPWQRWHSPEGKKSKIVDLSSVTTPPEPRQRQRNALFKSSQR